MDLGLVAGSGWAAGLNVYAVVLVLGLLGRLTEAPIPDQLTTVPVLVLAGIGYVLEFVADKIPYIDNIWDMVHTVVRPVAAGWLGYLLAGEIDLQPVIGAGTSTLAALGAHSTKATTRAAVNVSPEPVSNIGLSIFEDGLAAGMVMLAAASPLLALIVVVILLVGGVVLVVVLWRAIIRVVRRIRDRWARSPQRPAG